MLVSREVRPGAAPVDVFEDAIVIKDLEVWCHVGVTNEERTQRQKLLVTLEMARDLSMAARTDQLVHSIDYQRVCEKVKQLVLEKSWRLIEAMAGDIIQCLHSNFRFSNVSVEIRKFALPDTAFVAIHLTRQRP